MKLKMKNLLLDVLEENASYHGSNVIAASSGDEADGQVFYMIENRELKTYEILRKVGYRIGDNDATFTYTEFNETTQKMMFVGQTDIAFDETFAESLMELKAVLNTTLGKMLEELENL